MTNEEDVRDWGPVTGCFPDRNEISCKDCVYRDKELLELDGEDIPVGITRDTCLVFDGDKVGYKPHDVLFGLEDCNFYEKDEAFLGA